MLAFYRYKIAQLFSFFSFSLFYSIVLVLWMTLILMLGDWHLYLSGSISILRRKINQSQGRAVSNICVYRPVLPSYAIRQKTKPQKMERE